LVVKGWRIDMKSRILMLALAAGALGAAVCLAQDPNLGTWKRNEAKSKMPAGLSQNNTVVMEAAGDNIKVTMDGTDKDGKPTHSEWTGKFDGNDYPVTGNPNVDSRSYKKIDDHKMETTNKKDGKVVLTAQVEISKDGKTRTVHVTQTDSAGKKVTGKAVFEKQ
jgi:hypothetical protein